MAWANICWPGSWEKPNFAEMGNQTPYYTELASKDESQPGASSNRMKIKNILFFGKKK